MLKISEVTKFSHLRQLNASTALRPFNDPDRERSGRRRSSLWPTFNTPQASIANYKKWRRNLRNSSQKEREQAPHLGWCIRGATPCSCPHPTAVQIWLANTAIDPHSRLRTTPRGPSLDSSVKTHYKRVD
ncbi:hypothetical protein J6590_012205 [Homalodisca vitripennis]|nr:hypothetical protein J6590_012205 [Homalodisca vitripennis]